MGGASLRQAQDEQDLAGAGSARPSRGDRVGATLGQGHDQDPPERAIGDDAFRL
jgi:hypothetical protein